MYKVKDNAEAQLQFGISSVATTLVVKEGQGVKFPEVPFLVVLNKRNSDGEITKSEKVEVSAVSGDQFTISRGYEGTTPSDFSADDFVSLFVLARHIIEIQEFVQEQTENVDEKLEKLSEKMESAEGQITQLVESGTPDHIEIKDIVGEKYQLSSMLTRHYLPQLLDSAIPLNFGEVAANKKLHIQRISSGHTDNKIKIKLRKKGNPSSNIMVEVRKGVKVEAGNLIYRYGGEVLATATIPANQITTNRKEFTATLDKNPLLARGELYSIVVKCQNSVYHGSDYYQIACGSQWSECFCTIQDNNTTRTRIDYEVYCESLLFLDYCLAKISNVVKEKILFDIIDFTGSSSYDYNLVLSEDNQQIRVKPTNGRPVSKVIFFRGESQIGFIDYISYNSFADGVIPGKKGETIRISIRMQTNSNVQLSIFRRLTKPAQKKLFPKAVNEVGALSECVIFGAYNGQFVGDQIDTTISSSATTGGIPPANAVGYMSIIGQDGKKYKIRVYGD